MVARCARPPLPAPGVIQWLTYENLRQHLFQGRDKDSLTPGEGVVCVRPWQWGDVEICRRTQQTGPLEFGYSAADCQGRWIAEWN